MFLELILSGVVLSRAIARGVGLAFLSATLWFAGSAQAAPALPNINTNNILVVTNAPYNAVGDGVTTNTAAIQSAINAAALGGVTNGLSGGTVRIPAGVYLSGPLTFKSAVNLQIDSGAVLRMLPFGKYPATWTTNSATNFYFTAANFISASSLNDIEISGSGAIDGQGAAWWPWANTNGASRPRMIAVSSCKRILIQNVTLSNSPMFHIAIGGKSGNTTVQGVTIRANSSSDPVPGHNTDACDVSGTNILVQNCNISVGDDNFTCGGGTSDVLITNNTYGNGHGVSIGSYTDGGVSNITVVNCTFNNTDQGIRIKSDRDRGGLVQNISYLNLSMTNVMRPILIYCQYTNTTSAYRAVDSITPAVAASYASAPVTSKTPMYRNIVISNITATTQSGRTAGLIWGLPEAFMTNVTLIKVKITGAKTFGIYCARGVKVIDSQIITPSGVNALAFYDTQVTLSNSAPTAGLVLLDGASTNTITPEMSFYNTQASLKSTNALGNNPLLTLGASTLTVSNYLTLSNSTVLNFVLGPTATRIAVVNSLTLNGTLNVISGNGFGPGNYTLLTYGGSLGGNGLTLGSVPAGYAYQIKTNTAGQVNLAVTLPTTNLLTSSQNPSANFESVAFTATITPSAATGTVQFITNGVAFGSPVLLSGGVATSAAITALPRGTNTVTVEYAGDANYSGSTNSLFQLVTNHPPVANLDSIVAVKGMTFQFPISDLLTNDTDADGDPLTFSSVGPLSTNGVAITSDGTSVFYTGSVGVADRFDYVISDGYGGSATGLVMVIPGNSPSMAAQTVSLTMDVPGAGTNTLIFAGTPGDTYVAQFTTNLSGSPWFDLSTNVAGTNGLWTVFDMTATNDSRFYRALVP